jgi:hypothetical protein
MQAHIIHSATEITPFPTEYPITSIVGILLHLANIYYREKYFGKTLLVTFSDAEKKEIIESSFCIVGLCKIDGPNDEERVFVSALQAAAMRYDEESKGRHVYLRVASFKMNELDDNGFILHSPPQAASFKDPGIYFKSFDGDGIC